MVLSRGILHASGPYECPNVRIVGKVVATNTPPSGAFRGFGAPQTLFAAELHMEKIAANVKAAIPHVAKLPFALLEGLTEKAGSALEKTKAKRIAELGKELAKLKG